MSKQNITKALKRVSKIVQIAEDSKSLDELSQKVVDLIASELDYEVASIAINENNQMRLQALTKSTVISKAGKIFGKIMSRPYPIQEKPKNYLQKAAVYKKLYYSKKTYDFTRPFLSKTVTAFLERLIGTGILIAVPCWNIKKTEAVLVLYSKKPKFTREEREILMTLGRQIGYVIRSIRLIEESEGERDEMISLLNESVDGFLISLPSKILFASPKFSVISEFSQLELVGKHPYSLLPKAEKERVIKLSEDWTKTTTGRGSYRTRILTKTKRYIPVEINSFPIRYKRQNARLAIFADIKKEEKTLIKLEHMYKSQAEFFSEIAHSLKTPFTVINGLIELNIDRLEGAPSHNLLKMIKNEVDTASDKISNLLSVAKLELTEYDLKPQKVDSRTFIEAAYIKGKALGYKYCSPDHDNECSCYKLKRNDEATLYFDKDAIMDVLTTLIENAYIHSTDGEEKPEISMQAKNKNDYLEIKIQDKGKGISKKQLDKIFKPFATSKKVAIHGIGLPSCKKIIEQHKGLIRVKSKINKGTEFTVKLPTGKPKPNRESKQ